MNSNLILRKTLTSHIKIIVLIFMLLITSFSYAEKRVALVIGNAAYQNSPLRNTVNDATSMAQALRSLGFNVVEKHNLNQRAMNQEIRNFGQRLLRSDVGLFYFAGHGMQVKGINYLIPVGYNVKHEDEIQYEAVNANRILSKMESAKNNLNIIILDACRNNPFKRSFRSSASGLARMEAPKGTIISYATAPGKVSSDGRGKNGLYTSHLLKHIRKAGITINEVFRLARVGVYHESKRIGNEQLPWEASSLLDKFCFASCGKSKIPNPNILTSVIAPSVVNKPVVVKPVEKKGHSKQWYIDRWKQQQVQSTKQKKGNDKQIHNSEIFRYTTKKLPSEDGWNILLNTGYERNAVAIENNILHLNDQETYSGSTITYHKKWRIYDKHINIVEFKVKLVSSTGYGGIFLEADTDTHHIIFTLYPNRIVAATVNSPNESSYYFDTSSRINTYKIILKNEMAYLYINNKLVIKQKAGRGNHTGRTAGVSFGCGSSKAMGEAYIHGIKAYRVPL